MMLRRPARIVSTANPARATPAQMTVLTGVGGFSKIFTPERGKTKIVPRYGSSRARATLYPPTIIGSSSARHHAMPAVTKNSTRRMLAGSPPSSAATVPGSARSPRKRGQIIITRVTITPPPITPRSTNGASPWRRNPLSTRLVSKNRNGNMMTRRPAQIPANTASASSVSSEPFTRMRPVEASQTNRDMNRAPKRLMPSTLRRSRDHIGTGSVSGGSGVSGGVVFKPSSSLVSVRLPEHRGQLLHPPAGLPVRPLPHRLRDPPLQSPGEHAEGEGGGRDDQRGDTAEQPGHLGEDRQPGPEQGGDEREVGAAED